LDERIVNYSELKKCSERLSCEGYGSRCRFQLQTLGLSFQHFEEELAALKTMYGKPTSGIILCKVENEFIGCAGIRKIDEDIAELKRMFKKPFFQKHGIGKQLLGKAVALARA